MKSALGVLFVLASLASSGCIARPPDVALATAPSVPGTLYIMHPSSRPDGLLDVEVRHDGALIDGPSVAGMLIARAQPALRISTKVVATRSGGCAPMAISPRGIFVACLRSDGSGIVSVMRRDAPTAPLHDTRARVSVDTHHIVGFTSDTEFAVAGDDSTCPTYYRTDAHVYAAEPRARLFVIDAVSGRTVRSGPCIHGLVTGDRTIVYVGHDSSDEPQYSRDGTNWQPGLVVALDGDGHVLAIDKSNRLVDEQDRLVSDDVVDAMWTR
jgi:hypothetical protein